MTFRYFMVCKIRKERRKKRSGIRRHAGACWGPGNDLINRSVGNGLGVGAWSVAGRGAGARVSRAVAAQPQSRSRWRRSGCGVGEAAPVVRCVACPLLPARS